MTGMARLPYQSQIKQELSPLYFSNSLSEGWTLPLSMPCLGQHHIIKTSSSLAAPSKQDPPPKPVGPFCLPGLSPKTVPHESPAQEREKEKEESEMQVHNVGVVTGSQDRNTQLRQVC